LSTLTRVEPGAILVENVSRRFRVYPTRNITLKEAIVRRHRERPTDIWALRDVTLDIEPGESVGIVGRNGSGKTTFLRLLAGIFKPTSGQIAVGGSVGSLLSLGAGFHMDFTGRENIFLSGAIYGMKRSKIEDSLDDIIEFTELERFIDLPVRTYSSGMYMRLGFAIAVHIDADVLLLDEIFTVGDEAFQRKCIDRILAFKRSGGTTVFVSHAPSSIERMCDRAVLLRDGRVVYDGAAHDVLRQYSTLLADEESATESSPASDWGSGEVRITRATLEGTDGVERQELGADEPASLRIWVASEVKLPPPAIAVELRDMNGGLMGSHVQSTAELGWDGSPGERVFRFELDRLPVLDGRYRFGVALYDPNGARTYHRLERAAEFLVGPSSGTSGWMRFSGRFILDESASMAPAR
jgi:ABC-type polysaccharide/polyol phosphate transport system ATPase subunit